MSFEISVSDLSALALGSSILACGGGGNPYYGQLVARDTLIKTGPVEVIDVGEMKPDAVAISPAVIGAPLVGIEKPTSMSALRAGFDAVERSLGTRIGAFVAAEVGGAQSVLPLLLAAHSGRPLLDGDGMGRAFPEAQMCTFLIYGVTPGLPAALSDEHGLLWRFPPLPFGSIRFGGTSRAGGFVGVILERLFRRYCAYKGGLIYLAFTLNQDSLKRTLIRGSVHLALKIGREIESARANSGDPVEAILQTVDGKSLCQGKIVDVERRFKAGHDWGTVRIEGIQADRGRRADISFKNEYLVLRIDEETVLTVPDLVTIVETQTGTPITSEMVRPGLRVSVIGIQSSPLLRTTEALRVVGPEAFGYDLPFVPLNDEKA